MNRATAVAVGADPHPRLAQRVHGEVEAPGDGISVVVGAGARMVDAIAADTAHAALEIAQGSVEKLVVLGHPRAASDLER